MSDNKKEFKLVYKIFEISNLLQIEKDKSKKGHYRFYNIEDVLIVLKPMLKERNLLLRFKHGSIKENTNVYSLCIEVLDLETGEKIEDEDNQVFETNTKIMSQPQAVNVAKTFLKKNLINSLFNIIEPDPDRDDSKQEKEQEGNISPARIKRYYAILAKKFETNEIDGFLDKLVKEAFKVESKKDMTVEDYTNFLNFAEKATKEKIIGMLNRKIKEQK